MYYDRHGVRPQGVCNCMIAMLSPVPPDLRPNVVVCPEVDNVKDDNVKDADDLFTIRMAMRFGCQFGDNGNYRDWKREEGKRGADWELREWLLRGDRAKLKVAFLFDRKG